ncbi:transcriptional regulator, MerR family [Segniliparus rotundus DSM 44985]|uniref:Transcriptional regulator, MerR family n=1 Tax=Segniliparus rotundus (strain ATCC BAA-972 / CDC 1076 / CIP 108378 / DSM 44985 / JCM 13578) TaxID=640132 RepID=D6Z7H4_SEGRD|nr:helix-turn-helix transcriptional regulator [Segniliparus rotundus]ADG97904.1 transcriptional regulator, MerR family [Segniliparus rotundus DSM 44985]
MNTNDNTNERGQDPHAKVLVISVAAQLSGMHAQTLRAYDRMGLVSPGRAPGGGRRYSLHDVELLREVQRLSQEEGVNLAGIKRIMELTQEVIELRRRLVDAAEAARTVPRGRELVPFPKSTALVVWKPRKG